MTANYLHSIKAERDELLSTLQSRSVFDTVIIGGGIHGAVMARQLAEAGLSVALFEKADYAGGTSSRSSKMAHGGLRYLEMLDFEQVFEGIKAREELFDCLPNFVIPCPFLIPVMSNSYWFRLKLAIGLRLYDLMVKKPGRKHSWIPRASLDYIHFHAGRRDLMGCFRYFDGLLDDSRLVIENILAARLNGALCINYCGVTGFSRSGKEYLVSAGDHFSGKEFEVRARTIVNCAGLWVNHLLPGKKNQAGIRYSRGTHLLFTQKWKDPALFLPMEGKSRYYFIWPHAAGTMVGTTERELPEPVTDPLPAADEIEEILHRLDCDLPDSGLNRSTLHYAFAGIRTLPLRDNQSTTGTLSRKHIWDKHDGILSLYGGKLTTAEWTVREGVELVTSYLSKPLSSKLPLSLPGGKVDKVEEQEIISSASDAGIAPTQAALLIARYGSLAKVIISSQLANDTAKLSKAEIDFLLDYQQALTIEDVLRRRTLLEFFPSHGLEFLDDISAAIKKRYPLRNLEQEASAYRDKLGQIHRLLQIAPPTA